MSDLMVGAGGPAPVYEPFHLDVGGVGQGSQTCTQKVRHNILTPVVGGRPVWGTFEAPEIESDRVPALLGLKTLTNMHAIMDMNPEHPRLVVPGPGGVTLNLGSGTKVYPLEPTHSGHLLLPCSFQVIFLLYISVNLHRRKNAIILIIIDIMHSFL